MVDVREFIAEFHAADRNYIRALNGPQAGKPPLESYQFADRFLDALSAAGMTICGEQVGELNDGVAFVPTALVAQYDAVDPDWRVDYPTPWVPVFVEAK